MCRCRHSGARPIYFYLLFMAIKIPLAVLFAFVAGVAVSIKRWRHPGYAFALFMFLFWIVPYSLVGAKWLRYTLSLMPFVYMLAAAGAVALARFISKRAGGSRRVELVTCAAVLIVFVVQPAWSAYKAAPHYALYTNALAADKVGYYFPHDEFYDDGLREAIQFVCEKAPPGAIVAHETPAATRYYLERCGRSDLNSQEISTPGLMSARFPALFTSLFSAAGLTLKTVTSSRWCEARLRNCTK